MEAIEIIGALETILVTMIAFIIGGAIFVMSSTKLDRKLRKADDAIYFMACVLEELGYRISPDFSKNIDLIEKQVHDAIKNRVGPGEYVRSVVKVLIDRGVIVERGGKDE